MIRGSSCGVLLCAQNTGESPDQGGERDHEMGGGDILGDALQSHASKKKKGKKKKRPVSSKKRKNLGGFSEFVTMEKVAPPPPLSYISVSLLPVMLYWFGY